MPWDKILEALKVIGPLIPTAILLIIYRAHISFKNDKIEDLKERLQERDKEIEKKEKEIEKARQTPTLEEYERVKRVTEDLLKSTASDNDKLREEIKKREEELEKTKEQLLEQDKVNSLELDVRAEKERLEQYVLKWKRKSNLVQVNYNRLSEWERLIGPIPTMAQIITRTPSRNAKELLSAIDEFIGPLPKFVEGKATAVGRSGGSAAGEVTKKAPKCTHLNDFIHMDVPFPEFRNDFHLGEKYSLEDGKPVWFVSVRSETLALPKPDGSDEDYIPTLHYTLSADQWPDRNRPDSSANYARLQNIAQAQLRRDLKAIKNGGNPPALQEPVLVDYVLLAL